MHLLNRAGGHKAQDELWSYMTQGMIQIRPSDPEEQARMRQLMTKYRDTPMDLADAALVAANECVTG